MIPPCATEHCADRAASLPRPPSLQQRPWRLARRVRPWAPAPLWPNAAPRRSGRPRSSPCTPSRPLSALNLPPHSRGASSRGTGRGAQAGPGPQRCRSQSRLRWAVRCRLRGGDEDRDRVTAGKDLCRHSCTSPCPPSPPHRRQVRLETPASLMEAQHSTGARGGMENWRTVPSSVFVARLWAATGSPVLQLAKSTGCSGARGQLSQESSPEVTHICAPVWCDRRAHLIGWFARCRAVSLTNCIASANNINDSGIRPCDRPPLWPHPTRPAARLGARTDPVEDRKWDLSARASRIVSEMNDWIPGQGSTHWTRMIRRQSDHLSQPDRCPVPRTGRESQDGPRWMPLRKGGPRKKSQRALHQHLPHRLPDRVVFDFKSATLRPGTPFPCAPAAASARWPPPTDRESTWPRRRPPA